MFKLKVNSIEPVRHQATDSVFLDVSISIYEKSETEDEDILIETRKIGYNRDISAEDLQIELDRVLAGFVRDHEQAQKQLEQDRADEHVANIREEMIGHEIELESTGDKEKDGGTVIKN